MTHSRHLRNSNTYLGQLQLCKQSIPEENRVQGDNVHVCVCTDKDWERQYPIMQTYRKIFACKKNQHVYPKDCHHPPHLTQLTAKNHIVPTLKPCRQHQQCPMCGKPQLHKASVKTGDSQSTRCWAVIRWNENTGMMTAPGWSVSSHNPAVWRYFHMGNRSGSSHWALRVVTCCQQAHTRVPFPRFPCCQNVISGRLPKPTHGCPRLIVQPLWKQSIL